MASVLLASCSSLPGLHSDEGYLIRALQATPLEIQVVPWTAAEADGSAASACLPRGTWDYFKQPVTFESWLARVNKTCQLINSLALIRWNLHKGYLEELAAAGVPTIPTLALQRGSQVNLARELESRGWGAFVIKPAIGAGASDTQRYDPSQIELASTHLQRLLTAGDARVQPFLPDVLAGGERSLIAIEGEITHTVVKRAAAGDWRVQDDFGGTYELVDARPKELDIAGQVLAALPEPAVYARIDLLNGPEGEPLVIEVELIEPMLYFECFPPSATRLAEAIVRRVLPSDGVPQS